MNLDSIIFDLDGTLWDTTTACAVAWNEVVASHGVDFREITHHDVRKVTGKPHDECIRLTFEGIHEETVNSMIEATKTADNEVIARMGGILYPGVREGLQRLSETHPLYIVSNCQQGYIENFLDKSGLGPLFKDFECFGNTGRPKGYNLASVIARNNLTSTIMIGDADGDEVAARQCGVPYVFVTYGFGTPIKPDFTVDSFGELVELLRA